MKRSKIKKRINNMKRELQRWTFFSEDDDDGGGGCGGGEAAHEMQTAIKESRAQFEKEQAHMESSMVVLGPRVQA